jgi:pimeloyl-ACP methyl ester carboxylesterase
MCEMSAMDIQPFKISIAEEVLSDLRDRLRRTRWPDQVAESGWAYGTDQAYLRELVKYWIEKFDWHAQENKLNRFPHFLAEVDGLRLHFIHQRGRGPNPFPLLITHGWPGSFVEFAEIIGPLTDPAAHGGDPADAFDVIIPSLPGYGFSERPSAPGMDMLRVAALFANLMEGLGYTRWGAQGGDWGAGVSTALGGAFADRVAAIHLNMLIGVRPPSGDAANLSEEDRALLGKMNEFRREETAYMQLQGTKPQTVGHALNDSPAGLASWIVEKFRTWSDCGGEVEKRFTKDQLLTNITLYWVTETINSSMRLYYETMHSPLLRSAFEEGGGGSSGGGGLRVGVPTGVASFPGEIYRPPRAWAESMYNITHWTDMPEGGHFAAMEVPGLLVADIRAFFGKIRQ